MANGDGVLVLVLLVMIWSALPSTDSAPVAIYPLKCSTKVIEGKCNARIVGAVERFRVRADFSNQRVIVSQGSVTSQLQRCSVFDSEEWACYTPMGDSGGTSHQMLDGQYNERVYWPAELSEFRNPGDNTLVYVSRWRWWRERLTGGTVARESK